MPEALRFFKEYEIWIYVLLSLGGLVYVRKFILAWDELRAAAFGLERESAQGRLNQSAGMLVLLLAMAIAEFSAVSFIVPTVPEAIPLPTATLDLLATPTVTLAAETLVSGSAPVATATLPPAEAVSGEGCLPDQVMLTEPTNGTEVSGVITLTGTADIQNFGFYKYEIQRPGDAIWLTIQAGREVKQNAALGTWDTTTLSPGDYLLRLVVSDNQGVALPPCVIQVRVNNPAQP